MKRIYIGKFHADHFIADHPTCGVLHGHTYHLRVEVDFPTEQWLDFGDLKKAVETLLKDHYDHTTLGLIQRTVIDDKRNPKIKTFTLVVQEMTCEMLAVRLKQEIGVALLGCLGTNFTLEIELWETDKFGVRY